MSDYATLLSVPLQPLLTKEEVAKLLRCHPRTVDQYERDGNLVVVKLGRRGRRYRTEDVEAFIASRATDEGAA